MKTVKNLIIILISIFFVSCTNDDIKPNTVDEEIASVVQSLNGNWVSLYTQIWDNNVSYASYNSNEIDCNTHYDYQFKIVKELNINNLVVTNTYFCDESKITTFQIMKNEDDIIVINEMDGDILYMRYVISVLSENKIVLTGTPVSENYFKPWKPFNYVIELKRKGS